MAHIDVQDQTSHTRPSWGGRGSDTKLLSSRTHETSHTNYHVSELKAFLESVNEATAGIFPNTRASPYDGVYALLLLWEDDSSLGCECEVKRLEATFKEYNFNTEIWPIPTRQSYEALEEKIVQFKGPHRNKSDLLIVYYGGHGYANQHGESIWLCHNNVDGPSVDWFQIQVSLERTTSDVLLILDCCHAASAKRGPRAGTTELLAACGWDDFTPVVGKDSFTSAIIEVLESFKTKGQRFTAAQLHAHVLTLLKNRRANNRKTPIHILLTDDVRKSLEISPMPVALPCMAQLSPQSSASTSQIHPASEEGSGESQDTPPSSSGSGDLSPIPSEANPHALIAVSLDGDQTLDLQAWIEWLRDMPALAKSVRIHAEYRSYSTLLIVSMPIVVWDLLPDNPACSFIGFIKSDARWDTSASRVLESLEAYESKLKAMLESLALERQQWLETLSEKTLESPSLKTSHLRKSISPISDPTREAHSKISDSLETSKREIEIMLGWLKSEVLKAESLRSCELSGNKPTSLLTSLENSNSTVTGVGRSRAVQDTNSPSQDKENDLNPLFGPGPELKQYLMDNALIDPILPPKSQDVSKTSEETPAISDPFEVRRVMLIARDTEYHTLNQTDRDLLERTNGRIWDRILAEPETYILSTDEFVVFNFYHNDWPHRSIAENAVKRYWDSQPRKANGH